MCMGVYAACMCLKRPEEGWMDILLLKTCPLTVFKGIVHGGWGGHLLFERNISDYIYIA